METRRPQPALRTLLWLLVGAWVSGPAHGMQVTVLNPFNVVILFQPVTLQCNYQTSATQPPIVTWKYKSYCRSRLADAFSPSSQENQINNQLQQNNPGYNPYVECQDSTRTVRVVATKQGNAVTLGDFYQGRRITITNNADLSIDQTAWGDSGVYYCTVTSSQDLQGNNEAYAELIVLGKSSEVSELLPGFQIGHMEDWLFVILVVLGFLLILLLFGICWCQCCPHTCCCYVRCPCCPEKCCCPEALYAAGKAATAGVPSIYAPSVGAPSIYSHPNPMKLGPPATTIPMGPMSPMYNGYGAEYDRASSVGGNSSQVPLLRDTDSGGNSAVRSGYRIQANQQDDSMRVLYYMEKELANFDPTRPGQANGKLEKASVMSEISSLHEDDRRQELRQGLGRLRSRPMSPISDMGEGESGRGSETRRLVPPPRRGERYEEEHYARRPRSHSVDDLDRDWSPQPEGRGRGRGRQHRDSSPDWREEEYYGQRRSRSRDDLRELDRGHYDGRLLQEALRKKGRAGSREDLDGGSGSSARSGYRRDRDEDGFPPPPPPYTETESVSSRGKNDRKLRRNHDLSRESLVV
ncbi:lipolysis-stimulated lipoprotein receptor isoform X1 [Terrapene carolina triunguis]|uniref:lipolysis-stimulated lipoprotein receptor isoform X1 n=1 Tax=Terrapene triunguis TaxID=2587831 RepID=UPI000CEFBE4D|nr:lipolysis-stimulated lipoprotein receptor isoform X1 [Terrapene carolina triunguis]